MKVEFRIEFAHWSSSDGSNGVHLAVMDAASGTYLADVRLTPAQFTDMMRGGIIRADGECSSHLDRVGKRMENASFPVPHDVPGGDRSTATGKVLSWAAEQDFASEWESFEARATNAGWLVVVRRWVKAGEPS